MRALEDRRVVDLLDRVSVSREDRKLIEPLLARYANDPADLLAVLGSITTHDWDRRPVPVETFLTHRDYLGLGGERGRLFPGVLDLLVRIFEGGYKKVYLDGGIGWGKSTIAECAGAYMLYYLSCLKAPQLFFGLNADDTIAVMNVSVNVTQAKKVVFSRLKEKIKASPYFIEAFPFDPLITAELAFPKNIRAAPTAASEGGTVGYTVYGAVMDEVNFWQIVESSALARGDRFDQAEHIDNLLERRIESRFMDRGGPLIGVSSSKYPDSFTEKKRVELKEFQEKAAKGEIPEAPKWLIVRNSHWSVRDPVSYGGKQKGVFWVYIGGKPDRGDVETGSERTSVRPFMTMHEAEIAPFRERYPERVVEVPNFYYQKFYNNLEGSIRDLAGHPTLAIRPWMKEMDKVMEAIERGRSMGLVHPFNRLTTSLEDGGAFDPRKLKFDASKFYFAHVDLAKGHKDKVGLAVGHVDHWMSVTRTLEDEDGHPRLSEDIVPFIVIDVQLKIEAPSPSEDVKTDLIRGLLLTMREHGCNLRKVSFDQWQSLSSQQSFERHGIESEEHSVDRNMDSHNAFKEAAMEDRLAMYFYQPMLEELATLEHIESKDKVDHPPGGAKDISDAVVAVCYHCTESRKYGIIGEISHGEVESDSPLSEVPAYLRRARSVARKKGRRTTADDILDALLREADPYRADDEGEDDYIGFA